MDQISFIVEVAMNEDTYRRQPWVVQCVPHAEGIKY